MASLLTLLLFVPVKAQPVDSPAVVINRFKVISGDQYVELKNISDAPVDMSNVRLIYYNKYDLSEASSSKLISMTGELPAGGYYLLNDSTQLMCYQSMVASASLSFATGSGRIQLMQLTPTGDVASPLEFMMLDEAGWDRGKDPLPGAVNFPATSQDKVFALRDWGDEVPSTGGGQWLLPSAGEPCVYQLADEPIELKDDKFAFATGKMPPVRHVAAASTSSAKINRNKGKAAPIINELLPNPASPQTDADNEFIELYNPNDSTFDLSGFKLAFGSTSPKRFTFPEGTMMKPKEFKAFNSGDTSISLSNTKAQVWLLDPKEAIIGTTKPYQKAKDGQAWTLDNGKWVWSLQPTPGKANVVALPITASSGESARAVLGISDETGVSGSGSGGSEAGSGGSAGTLADKTPLHPVVLAVVAAGAVAYAVYEYRQDLSNKLFELRRNNAHRRALRQKVPRR